MASTNVGIQANDDPTNTTLIRNDYERSLVEWFKALQEQISPRSFNQNVSDPPEIFEFEEDSRRIDAFLRWLQKQEQDGVLTIIEENNNRFIKTSYRRGVEHAEQALQQQGIDLETEEVENLFRLPVHEDTLETLFTRNYRLLEGITTDMDEEISRILTQGFAEGRNPNRMASQINDSIDDIGIQRSRTLARTEVINAHSESTIRRFEQAGVEDVRIEAEWSHAGDRRVCPICRALQAQGVMTLESVKNGTFEFEPGEEEQPSLAGKYPRKPPAHPNCRCALLPVV